MPSAKNLFSSVLISPFPKSAYASRSRSSLACTILIPPLQPASLADTGFLNGATGRPSWDPWDHPELVPHGRGNGGSISVSDGWRGGSGVQVAVNQRDHCCAFAC